MKKLYFISFLSALILTSCSTDFSKFNEHALNFAIKNKEIDQKEYESLLEQINLSDEKAFQQFKRANGQIDNSKVVFYLLKYFAAKRISIKSEDIWQPETTKIKDEKFNINVFLENSASIDGYVGENSTYKTTIFKLLTDLKNFSSTDSLNLNYINTKPIPIKVSASRDDIDDFYKRLNPNDFKSAGGLRGGTDIEKMLKQLLDKSNKRNLSVFISDCVFSPGGKDAKKYLDGQYAAIYNDFTTAKNLDSDLSIIILQCSAKFEGTYYDYFDKKHLNLNIERPYYIWFIGESQQVKKMVDNKIFDLIKNGYKNKLVIEAIKEVTVPNHKILYRPRIGEFDSKLLSQDIITKAAISNNNQSKGKFGFGLAVDFSSSLQDSNYFLDTANYQISDKKYSYKIATITDKFDAALSGFTHILSLQTDDLNEEMLKIDITGRVPSWVYISTSNNDTAIETDSSEKQKTFGLKYLVEGVCEAFYPKSSPNTINRITITIKR